MQVYDFVLVTYIVGNLAEISLVDILHDDRSSMHSYVNCSNKTKTLYLGHDIARKIGNNQVILLNKSCNDLISSVV